VLTDGEQRGIFDIWYDTVALQWDNYEEYLRQVREEEERLAREKEEREEKKKVQRERERERREEEERKQREEEGRLAAEEAERNRPKSKEERQRMADERSKEAIRRAQRELEEQAKLRMKRAKEEEAERRSKEAATKRQREIETTAKKRKAELKIKEQLRAGLLVWTEKKARFICFYCQKSLTKKAFKAPVKGPADETVMACQVCKKGVCLFCIRRVVPPAGHAEGCEKALVAPPPERYIYRRKSLRLRRRLGATP